MSCIFCDIIAQKSPAHIIWENNTHLAFLSIFPNTPGVTVVIPKTHYPSYAFSVDDDILCQLTKAAKQVALLLDSSLKGVARTAMIFEGYGIDHLHAKLFPMHGTGDDASFKQINSNVDKFFQKYEGYVSSHDYQRASDETLALLAKVITRHDKI